MGKNMASPVRKTHGKTWFNPMFPVDVPFIHTMLDGDFS